MNELDKTQLAQMNMLGGLVGTTHDFARETHKSLGSISKWLIGGAFAFCFVILTDPEKMMALYGSWAIKVSLFFFLISIYYGFRFIFGHHFHHVLSSSSSFKLAVEFDLALKKDTPTDEGKEADLPFDFKEGTQMAVNKSLWLLGTWFKSANSFWLQVVFILLPLGNFLYQFLFKL